MLDAPRVCWDNNDFASGCERFALFDRRTLQCHAPALAAAFLEACESDRTDDEASSGLEGRFA